MSGHDIARESGQHQVVEGRRRELRALLITAADAARQGRRVMAMGDRIERSIGRPIRERVATLLSAAG